MIRFAHILAMLAGLFAGVLGVTVPALAAPADAVADADTVYRVGPGDSLRIKVVGEEDLTGDFLVDEGGRLDLPMVGVLPADGLTPTQIGTRLTRRLEKDFLVDPQVSVQVENFASRPVQVLGAVREPGTYYLEGPTRLMEILAQVGGVLDEKSSQEVRVRRADDREPVVVDLEALMLTGDGDVMLSSGDVVHVLEGKVIYVNGQVGKPGSVSWKGGITVTRALALAGGAKATANLRKAYLLRDGQPLRLNLKRIFRGKDPDPVLRPGDQLLVGESAL
jgi:polysaccharide export outer membrane protein